MTTQSPTAEAAADSAQIPPLGGAAAFESIVAAFDESVRRHGDRVAVAHGVTRLTYAALDARARRLAESLTAMGVGAESLVGVFMERSVEAVVAVLAVWKAGGAYLPLDARYPRERIDFLLRDSGVSLVLTRPSEIDELPAGAWRAFVVEADPEAVPASRGPGPSIAAEQLAYVIYTSGSTGRPKGVAVPHRGLVNLLRSQIAGFGVTPDDRVLQFASFSFDAFVSELGMAILSGAALVLASPETLASSHELSDLVSREGVTVATMPPTMLGVLAPRELPSLRTVITAGEACSAEIVARWAGGTRFINAYGPTEATVCATFTAPLSGAGVPPIGRPLPHTAVYVLSSDLEPVPPGSDGEIYIAGVSLARGYVGRPGATAERFLPDPFARTPGSRMYRTGDRGRVLPDGQLHYVGRVDHQLKVRGFRIEPGEIERELERMPGVESAVVVGASRRGAPGISTLLAYYVGRPVTTSLELWPSVAEYFVYDDVLYGAMSSDFVRNRAYREVLEGAIAGKRVVEIGTGAHATLARMCVKAGASRVYAIEILEESHRRATELVRRLGFADRITVLRGDSTQLEIPEPADCCVSEIVGGIGGSEAAAYIINDAWRHLGPNGRMIPEGADTLLAAVELDEELLRAPAFGPAGAEYVRRIFAERGGPFDLRVCLKGLTEDRVVSSRGVLEPLDFRRPIALETDHRVDLVIDRPAVVSGLIAWLTLRLDPGHVLDTLRDRHSWLPVFLPIFGVDPPRCEPGDRLSFEVRRRLSANGRNPEYFLQGELVQRDGRRRPFDYALWHLPGHYRATPFYDRLFAGDAIPERPVVEAPTPTTFRRHLATRLPEYMIPSRFVELPAWPTTPNGKIDRAALPTVAAERPPMRQPYIAPEGTLETMLAGVFESVLGLAGVGAADDFFELGGDSLSAIQVLRRASDLGFGLAASAIFEHPTVADLAAFITSTAD
jgi:amino acid adenylation domain-containing protein